MSKGGSSTTWIERALHGVPRGPKQPARTFDGVAEAHSVALRCSDPPGDRSGWTMQLLADQMVALMEAVLDVYARPYDEARPVVCLDEKRKQLVRETRPGFTDSRGVRHEDYEYERNGVGVLYMVCLYMVCEPLGGRREVRVETSQDRLAWARAIVERLEIVHTPTHGSWLNIAEIELSVLGRQALAARIEDTEALGRIAESWSTVRTAAQKGVDWQFTTAEARVKLKHLHPSYTS